MKGLHSSLYQIIRHGLNTNSYKFALLCALVRIAPQTDRQNPRVTTRDLAPLFIELYWPLEVTYHLRQGTDPDKDPVVMAGIRKLMQQGLVTHGMTLAEFKTRHKVQYSDLVSLVERKAFTDVIPRLHTVRKAAVTPPLYTYFSTSGRAGGEVILTDESREFFIAEGNLVEYVAVAAWAKFTEVFSSSPKVITKLSRDRPKRGKLTHWRVALAGLQKQKCFYCNKPSLPSPHVDHVLPWSFMLEDRTWNLVLSCNQCNAAKSDRLPPTATIERLISRNAKVDPVFRTAV